MNFYSKQMCGIIFIILFLIGKPIAYDELVERQWNQANHIQSYKTTLSVSNSSIKNQQMLSVCNGHQNYLLNLKVCGGDQVSKTGPGARAKADARANAGLRKKNSAGSNFFADGYVPQQIYCNYNRDRLSCPRAHRNTDCPLDGSGRPNSRLPMDEDGYCIAKNGKKFVQIQHEHNKIKFETPTNLKSPPQDPMDLIGPEKISLKTDIRKRQINQKYKHKGEFKNSDGSATIPEFRDEQIEFLKKDTDTKYASDCILLGNGSDPKDAVCVFDGKDCVVLEKRKVWDPETRSMTESPILEYIGPRSLRKNQYDNYRRYGVIGFDGQDITQARHGMTAEELMEIRSSQTNPFDSHAQCPSPINQDQ